MVASSDDFSLPLDDPFWGLGSDEISRCWLKPAETIEIAGFSADPTRNKPLYKRLANMADEQLLDFTKAGSGKTSARLYALSSIIVLRLAYELNPHGGSLKGSAKIAEYCLTRLREASASHTDVAWVLDRSEDVLVYYPDDPQLSIQPPRFMQRNELANFRPGMRYAYNVLDFSALLFSAVSHYVGFRNSQAGSGNPRAVKLLKEVGFSDEQITDLQRPSPPIGVDGWPIEDGSDA